MLGNYKLESLLKLYLLVIRLHLYIFEKSAFRFQANEAWKWRVFAFTKLPMILEGEEFAFPLHSV